GRGGGWLLVLSRVDEGGESARGTQRAARGTAGGGLVGGAVRGERGQAAHRRAGLRGGGVFGRGHHRGGGGFWGLVADGDRQCSGRRDLRLLVEGRGVPVFQDFFDRHLGECRRVVADEDTEDLHRGGAALRLFGEAGLQERPEPLVHSVEAGRLVEDPVDDRGQGFVVEGRLSGGGEHHDPGPGEDVHGRGEFASFHLFRGHVGGGADDGVGRGHRGLGVPGDPE